MRSVDEIPVHVMYRMVCPECGISFEQDDLELLKAAMREHLVSAEARRAARLNREAAEKAALEAERYSMFEPPEVSS